MNILHTLQAVAHFFRQSRRNGHTTAMLNGALNSADTIVLTHDMRHAQTLARSNPTIDVTAITNIPSLIGHQRPVLIDHAAIQILCEQAASTIEQNNAEIKRLEAELATASRTQQTLDIARQTIFELRESIDRSRRELCQIGLCPNHHPTLHLAVKGALEIAASLRKDLSDPPPDVQEAVLDKLNLRQARRIVEAAKTLKAAKGGYHNQIAATELFDLLP
jgi:hypothetical protein